MMVEKGLNVLYSIRIEKVFSVTYDLRIKTEKQTAVKYCLATHYDSQIQIKYTLREKDIPEMPIAIDYNIEVTPGGAIDGGIYAGVTGISYNFYYFDKRHGI